MSNPAVRTPEGSSRPNVVVLFPDQLRALSLPLFGEQQIDTPNIDRLASEGVVLENAIKGTPFFLSCGFSALDLYLSMMAEFHGDKNALFEKYPNIAALYQAVANRPAYIKTITYHS